MVETTLDCKRRSDSAQFKIYIRRAELRDMKAVFDLSNDSAVREHSICREPISWESHAEWFVKAIADPDLKFFVVETERGDFVGQVRFARTNGEWVVSISIVNGHRGKRLAEEILRRCIECARLEKIAAFIYDTNQASLRAFEGVGFKNSHLLKYVYDSRMVARGR